MARKSFKAGALTAPIPPVLVTVGEGDRANIITIGWTGILATHPPRTYISVRPERHSYKLLKEKGEFVIHLARASMAREVDLCGIYTGARVDKFRECNFTRVGSSEVSVPTIAECPVAIECRVAEVIPMGTHDVFIADIVGVSCDESILDADGRMCFERAGLLAYAHGEYYALGERLGRIGFSTDKPSDKRDKRAPSRSPSPQDNKKADAPNAGATDIADNTEGKAQNTGKSRTEKVSSKKPEAKKPRNTGGRRGESDKRDLKGRDAEGNASESRPFYLDLPRKYRGKKGGKGKK